MFPGLFSFFLILSINFWPFGTGRKGAEIKKTSLELPSGQELLKYETIKISLGTFSTVTVSTTGPFQVFDGKERPLFSGMKMGLTKVEAAPGGLRLGPENFPDTPLTVRTEGALNFGGKTYRSALKFWPEQNKILVINEISMEEYLKGVLPKEASASWPEESLKAQAIASRTYALFKNLEKKDEKFAVTKDVLSQVYGGKGAEQPETNRAVDETRGQILTFNGKIFPAYFHSTCGGKTTQAEYAWDVEPNKVLRGVDCNFCWSSKHYRWRTEFSTADIQKRLKGKGVKIGAIRDIQASDIDKSGRARSFLIVYDGGQVKLHSNDFRIWLDPGKFKSTFVTSIDRTGSGYIFEGRGWGHGVGMCQFGMRQLAKLGYNYKQITEYYYPEAKLTSLVPVKPWHLGSAPADQTE